jgi:hypothetical protein
VRIGTVDGDANFNRLKAALNLSISHFQRVCQTYGRPSWQAPVVLRRFVETRAVVRCRCELALRISIV